MSDLTNPRFWRAYGRFGVILAVGLGGSAALGVPAELAIRLLAGALISFPVAYKSTLLADGSKGRN